jgi:hypothetical protein
VISPEITICHRHSVASPPEFLYATYTDSMASFQQLLYATDTDIVASLPELPCNTDRRRLPWRLSRDYHMAQTRYGISPGIAMSHAYNFRH